MRGLIELLAIYPRSVREEEEEEELKEERKGEEKEEEKVLMLLKRVRFIARVCACVRACVRVCVCVCACELRKCELRNEVCYFCTSLKSSLGFHTPPLQPAKPCAKPHSIFQVCIKYITNCVRPGPKRNPMAPKKKKGEAFRTLSRVSRAVCVCEN